MARGKQWGDTKTQSYGNESWDKKVEWYQFPNGEEQRVRLVGSVYVVARHWPTILTKFKHGEKPKVYPTWCTKFDSITEEGNPERVCPLCDDFDMFVEKLAVTNVIIRKFQEGRNKRENAVVPVIWRHNEVEKVFKKAFEKYKADPADPKKGCDFSVEYDPNNKKNRWTIQREDQTPLTDEEKEYAETDFESLIPDYSDAEVMAEHARDMKKSIARSGYYVIPLKNDEDGWAAYKADINGKPFTSFPDLVSFKEGKGTAGSKAHSSQDNDDMPAARRNRNQDDDAPPARRNRNDDAPPAKPNRQRAEPDDNGEDAAPADDDDAPAAPPAKPAAKPKPAVVHADDDAPVVNQSARVQQKAPVQVEIEDDADVVEAEPVEDEVPAPKAAAKPAAKVQQAAPAAKSAATPTKHEAWTTKFGIIWNNKDGKNVPNCYGEYAGAKKCTSCPESHACIAASDS